MIDPTHYDILSVVLEWKWPLRVWVMQRNVGQAPVLTWTDGLPAQTDTEINTACDEWLATGKDETIRQKAVDLLAEVKTHNVMVLRALMLVLLDELNLHAAKINAILTAIDSGGTLAQVKNNIAAIADYPTRTPTQVRTAMNNKLTAGDADS